MLTWSEIIGADGELIRVAKDAAGAVRARVVVYSSKSWCIHRRVSDGVGARWKCLVDGTRRGRFNVPRLRLFRSPEAAMRVAEACAAEGLL